MKNTGNPQFKHTKNTLENTQTYQMLSFEQERMFFADMLTPGNPAYHIPGALKITGALNTDILAESINAVAKRHEILRTTFGYIDDEPAQIIALPSRVDMQITDLRKIAETAQESELQQEMRNIIRSPFDISSKSPWRAGLIRTGEEEYILVLSMHHILCDGESSIKLFFSETTAIYELLILGRPSLLPELPMQYKDYAFNRHKSFINGDMDSQRQYWLRNLGNEITTMHLPGDRPYPPVQTYEAACIHTEIFQNLSREIRQLSRQENVSVSVMMLAAFKILLHRYSGQSDILVGIPSGRRNIPDIDGLIGHFGNPLVLRNEMSNNPTFRKFLSSLGDTWQHAEDNQDYPFQKLVEALKPKRDMSRPQLFQVLFVPVHNFTEEQKLQNLTLTRIDVESGSVPYDLVLSFRESSRGIFFSWEYNTARFVNSTIEQIADHFGNLLESILSNPDQRVSEIPFLSDSELKKILEEWNDTQAEYPQLCVHEMFEAQVEKTPNVSAVAYENETLSFDTLNRRANQMARHLLSFGLSKNESVGLCLERSVEMIEGVLAIIKAGGNCLPLDPAYPQERLAYMLSDSGAAIVITTRKILATLPLINDLA